MTLINTTWLHQAGNSHCTDNYLSAWWVEYFFGDDCWRRRLKATPSSTTEFTLALPDRLNRYIYPSPLGSAMQAAAQLGCPKIEHRSASKPTCAEGACQQHMTNIKQNKTMSYVWVGEY
jgi:hypothetical protein